MEYEKVKWHLVRMSHDTLTNLIGIDLMATLTEWRKDVSNSMTKYQLADMIISLHGVAVIEMEEFRFSFFLQLNEEKFSKFILNGGVARLTREEKCRKLSKEKWGKSNNIELYLEMLNVPKSILDKKQKGDGVSIRSLSGEKFYELLDYQYVVRQRVLTTLSADRQRERMLVHMPTGTGKTKTMMHTIVQFLNDNMEKTGLVMWIAHTSELLMQAYDTFENVWKHLGDGEINVYKMWGNTKDSLDSQSVLTANGVVFCGIQKLCSIMNKDKTLYNNLSERVKLIVFDEAHKAAALETRKAVNGIMNRRSGYDVSLVGLTATPGRKSTESFDNEMLVSMFGGRLISIDTRLMNNIAYDRNTALNMEEEVDIIRYFQKRRILAKLQKEELEYEQHFTEDEITEIKKSIELVTRDGLWTDKALMAIARNRERNLTILAKLKELNQKSMPTIVFACSVEHAKLLSAMLKLDGIESSLILGDMPPEERRDAINRFKDRADTVNIIINYDVLTTGFDSKNIKCVFITRPTQSVVLYSQMIGRGLRGPMMGGNESCLLVDIKDNISKYNENRAFNYFSNYWHI